jgi:hypothetical protein
MNHPSITDTLLPSGELAQRFVARFGVYRWQILRKNYGTGEDWATETRYAPSPAQLWGEWQHPCYAIGVHFGGSTTYGMIDIDAGSVYRWDLAPILAALEDIGIVRYVPIQSSTSGGLHIYFAFPDPVNTFNLACALRWALQGQGVAIAPGQCETFPNTKAYTDPGQPKTEYTGHRLPLQPSSGSHLLDDGLQPSPGDIGTFLDRLDAAATAIDMDALKAALDKGRKWYKAKTFKPRLQGKQAAWKADLEAAIALGITGPGQKHEMIGRLVDYGYVFLGHQGDRLNAYVLQTLEGMPGFNAYVRPYLASVRKDLDGWMRKLSQMVAQGRRFMAQAFAPQPKGPSKNDLKAALATEGITQAMAQIDPSEYPTIRALVTRVRELSGCSSKTIYKPANLPLWHPEHRLEQGCKTAQPERVTDDLEQPTDPPPESPEALINGSVLHLGSMRGGPAEDASKNSLPLPDGGGAGGFEPSPTPLPGEPWLRRALLVATSPENLRELWQHKARYLRNQAALAATDPEIRSMAEAMLFGLGAHPPAVLAYDWDGVNGCPFWLSGMAWEYLSRQVEALATLQDLEVIRE